jgi:hypothetical protein
MTSEIVKGNLKAMPNPRLKIIEDRLESLEKSLKAIDTAKAINSQFFDKLDESIQKVVDKSTKKADLIFRRYL